MIKWASWLCWIIGLGLSVPLLMLWWTGGSPETLATSDGDGPVLVEVLDVECGPLAAGGIEHMVNVTVINRDRRPVRLIGASAGCVGYTCHDIDIRDTVVVPPCTEVQIPAKLKVWVPKPFDDAFEVFFDDGHVRSLTARFRGHGVSP